MPAILGQPLNRFDGRLKVTGRARYACDHRPDRLAHACGVMSTIASGTIASLDDRAARAVPGVLAIFPHQNFPRLKWIETDMEHAIKAGEGRPPLGDEKIYHAGQFVALVVAESFAEARRAAQLVRVHYHATSPILTLEEGLRVNGAKQIMQNGEETDKRRGHPAAILAEAAEKIDATYFTAPEAHNPMELHGTTARWDQGKVIVHDSTQWVMGQRNTLAAALGLKPEEVEVHAPFIGGGFGSKLFLWPHTVLAAAAARELDRPVRLSLARRDQFTTVGHRPATRQRVQIAADRGGKFLAIQHDSVSHTSLIDDFCETCAKGTRSLYHCAHVAVSHRVVPVNVGTPTSMRAPGATPGLFALESAVDELAVRLNLDPIELRLRNLPERDDDKKVPWSSHHLKECCRTAAAHFGWDRREATVGAMREGREILGWGFASAFWPAEREAAKVRIELRPDGTARVVCATQDIGTGTYTVFAQVVSELTSLPFEKIEVALGDSSLPPGPISGGSMVTASVTPAIALATRRALAQVFAAAVSPGGHFSGEAAPDLSVAHGAIVSATSRRKQSWEELFAALRLGPIVAEAETTPGAEGDNFSFNSFGAHCVEVGWDPGIAHLRVRRIVTAVDAGRIINRKTATNQVHGSLLMGLGLALREEVIYDERTGRVVNDNLADYHLPVHADLPDLQVRLLDYPDPHSGEYGAKGIGEIGITGVTAAIANAVYHATGRRLRRLPITIDQLLG
jgi:xanthine dehydrogenase YagR molybdenum-binding subunit